MARTKKSTNSASKSNGNGSSANLGFEAKLWLAADKLRNNMDAAEYKHVVLGLIFLKYISDSFEELHATLQAGKGEFAGADPEDPDEYRAKAIFWVPADARWPHLLASAKQPGIGKLVDDAMVALFPTSFQDSELGHIPKGWRACTLGDIAKNVSSTFDFKRMPEVVFINTGDVLEGDFLHSKRSHHVGLPGQAKKSIRLDDILFSEIRPANKRYAYVDFEASDFVVSTKFMIIRGSKEIHPRLLYRILTAKETLDEFQGQAESRSGTFPQITFDSISHLPIVLPPIEIQEAFQRAVGKLDAQNKVHKQQSRTLAALRDTLLPKLLSGEVVRQSS